MSGKRWSVLSQREVAEFCGVDPGTIQTWVRQGLPRHGAGKGRFRYDLSEIHRWTHARKADPPAAAGDDPLLAGTDSPGLERYRLARAALAELELDERQKNVVRVEVIRDALLRFADILRRLGDRLNRRYGADAGLAVYDAIDECRRVLRGEFGDTDTDRDTDA